MQRGLSLFFVLSYVWLVAACGNSYEVVSGSAAGNAGGGGSDTAIASTGGTETGGSSGASGGTCSPKDATASNCAPDDVCTCNPTKTTSAEWCEDWAGQGIYICPEDANICSPGHNQCGYDLPKGEDYIPPDSTCAEYIDGDTWAGDVVVKATLNVNKELEVRFGLLEPSNSYFNDFLVHGKKLLWNNANQDSYEWARGSFSEDCESITIDYYSPLNGGEEQPSLHTTSFAWSHP